SGEGRNRDTILHRVRNNITQRLLIFVSNLFEVRRQQKVCDTRILSVGIGDFLQELSANDTAGTEDLRNLTVVQIPVVLVRCRAQLREALRVRDDFTQVQRTTNFLNEFSFITSWLGLRARQNFRSGNTLLLQRGNVTCKHRFGDQGQRLAQIQRALAGPFTGTLVRCFIQNHINKVITLFIFFSEDIFGDVDQVAVQLAFVPLGEGLCELLVGEVQATFQQRVGFSNQLHVAIFNAVVNHFHVMTSAIRTDISHAWLTVFSYGCDFSQGWLNQFVRFFLTARHDGWTFQSALYTAGYAGTDEIEAFSRQFTVTTKG